MQEKPWSVWIFNEFNIPLELSEIVLVNDNSFIQTPHVSSGYCRTKTNIYRVRKSREKYIEFEYKGFIFLAGPWSKWTSMQAVKRV